MFIFFTWPLMVVPGIVVIGVLVTGQVVIVGAVVSTFSLVTAIGRTIAFLGGVDSLWTRAVVLVTSVDSCCY